MQMNEKDWLVRVARRRGAEIQRFFASSPRLWVAARMVTEAFRHLTSPATSTGKNALSPQTGIITGLHNSCIVPSSGYVNAEAEFLFSNKSLAEAVGLGFVG